MITFLFFVIQITYFAYCLISYILPRFSTKYLKKLTLIISYAFFLEVVTLGFFITGHNLVSSSFLINFP